ncbi:deoxycytidine triphosphate deaminase [Brucella anthropi]|uniref:Deoxycytidine triphosphate deaminase n=1 Tax=Brucella anthropi (strain ATCC 49188 / DSM 6882 / CCUG 24695 / JCM 21032 / LMG 3331 / NBRC 15819 / NCTC 12168 / Alc 37) TaxID=439375 RepID=A6WZ41_BRUA4|nr:deoxycytidine triphosphate deaminase [Brucella anthropi]ABS14245.1 deoxycytidine triphosphate deaminase [Brucella anthropi ATCC 49188]NKC48134.1 deoxycytidine triphosphate deaminase [Brucella anthropi ATCC 49188]QQC25772.1 deoxycytidine triphosphate deaminase [Brucella anthropi]SUA65486.1 Deoxycytidine triphosphate deaminase [Brucella anthropi]
MTILSAQSIRTRGIFKPFHERTLSNGMTFGLGPAGYDVRIAETLTLEPARRAVLASTMEHFTMPVDCAAYVKDKSTWARRFVLVQNTVIEPGWRGFLTLEISYEGQEPITIEQGSPIAQIIFHKLDEPTESPYAGKYQDQSEGAQPARLEGQ